MDDFFYELCLIRSRNIGPQRYDSLCDYFGGAEQAFKALQDEATAKEIGFMFRLAREKDIEKEIKKTEKLGARYLSHRHPNYPETLSALGDAPPVLIVKGNIELLNKPQIAIVGSRNASLNARQFTHKIAKALGDEGYVITSGLARGIDRAAHEGALETGTIGVIAGGIDHIYPRENKALYEHLYNKGLVISEMPIGYKIQAQDFPRRNRIVAGLSLGTLVVEAALRSGSLITARLSADYGREVFAVPGSPLDPRSEGTNDLIQNGAKLVRKASDVIDEIKPFTQNMTPSSPAKLNLSSQTREEEALFANNASIAENDTGDHEIAETSGKSLLDFLDYTPLNVDYVIREATKHLNMDASQCLERILTHEMNGEIKRHAGNKISRA